MTRIDDIWFAAKSTRIVYMPPKLLETFGESIVEYLVVCEAPEQDGHVILRTGKVTAERPRIITPRHYLQEHIENFSADARRYFEEILNREDSARIIQYGLHFSKCEFNCTTVTGNCEEIAEQAASDAQDDIMNLHGVIIAQNATWEISLMYFITELIRHSLPAHTRDFMQRGLIGGASPENPALRRHILAEMDACKSVEEASELAQRLREMGLFDKFEDEFFETYRRVKSNA